MGGQKTVRGISLPDGKGGWYRNDLLVAHNIDTDNTDTLIMAAQEQALRTRSIQAILNGVIDVAALITPFRMTDADCTNRP